MNAREWFTREILAELSTAADDEAETTDEQFDAALDAVLSEVGLSDRAIMLLMEAKAASLPYGVDRQETPLAHDPAIARRRGALGVTVDEAAQILGVPASVYERVEGHPAQWPNVRPDRLAPLLGRLGVSPASFLRWIATSLPTGQQPAWPYRPGALANSPLTVDTTGEGHDRFVTWGRSLLQATVPPHADPDVNELFGVRWSKAVLATRSAELAEAVYRRLLREPMQRMQEGASLDRVIQLPSPDGPQIPAFQFDDAGALRDVVGDINAFLGSQDDPWGVADWWLSVNSRLGIRPVDLIDGNESDRERLRSAARAVLEEE